MRAEARAEALKRQTDKLAALHAQLVKDLERREELEQEVEEYERAEEERLAREAEAPAAVAAGQPVGAQEEQVGGSQGSPLREEGAKGAGKIGAAVAPGVEAQDGSGQSNKGELSKIKATKGKLRMPKAGAIPEAAAKAVRDAKILAGTVKEGE